jgi:hypothetical protein
METPTDCNWIYHPNPLAEEVKLDFTWTADAKTTAALERQARCNECASFKDYLFQMITERLGSAEEDTVLSNDGRFVSGCYAIDENLTRAMFEASQRPSVNIDLHPAGYLALQIRQPAL